MVRFATPAKRRKTRQSNFTGAANLVPEELLVCVFGPKSGPRGHYTLATVRVLRDNNKICVQVEDTTSGAEGWMTIPEFKQLVDKLTEAARELDDLH